MNYEVLGYIVLATALSGLVSAGIAGLVLLLPDSARHKALPWLVSFATGALLGAAFIALLPHAIEAAGPEGVHGIGWALASGVLAFFILEKFVLWRHCHGHDWEAHTGHDHDVHPRDRAGAYLILVGDGLHNALDGALIAAAFMTDIQLGVLTAIAVAAHEIPQEVGDFAILLQAGFSRAKALWLNLATGLTAVIGGVIAFFALRPFEAALPYVIAVAAASLLYVAVADLIPALHRKFDLRTSLMQIGLIGLGILLIAVLENQAH